MTGDHPFTAEAIGRQVNLITLCTSHDVAEADGVEVADIDILNDDRVQVCRSFYRQLPFSLPLHVFLVPRVRALPRLCIFCRSGACIY